MFGENRKRVSYLLLILQLKVILGLILWVCLSGTSLTSKETVIYGSKFRKENIRYFPQEACEKYGLMTLVNLHTVQEVRVQSEVYRVNQEKQNLDKMIDLWKKLVKYFSRKPDKEQEHETDDRIKVGLVTIGSSNNLGYNHRHFLGYRGLQQQYDDTMRFQLFENISANQVESIFEELCDSGYQLIFSTDYEFKEMCYRVAQKYPKVVFMQFMGGRNVANVGSYHIRDWEGAYVCGIIAALSVAKGDSLGFIAPHPGPPTTWSVNAFALGAKTITPEINIQIAYTNSWYAPQAESKAIQFMAKKGIKAVYCLTILPISAFQTAEENNVYVMSHFSDLSSFAPQAWLTGTLWQWFPFYQKVTEQFLINKKELLYETVGFKEGCIQLAPFGRNVNNDAIVHVRKIIDKIITGEWKIFVGPIKDNTGLSRVLAGQILSQREILSLDWLVKGIEEIVIIDGEIRN